MAEESKASGADEREERGSADVEQPVTAPDGGRLFAVEGNDTSGYVGVSPEYRNYANEADRPILTDAERERLHEVGLGTDEEMTQPAQTIPYSTEESEDTDEDATHSGSDKSEGSDKGASEAPKTATPVKATPVKSTGASQRGSGK